MSVVVRGRGRGRRGGRDSRGGRGRGRGDDPEIALEGPEIEVRGPVVGEEESDVDIPALEQLVRDVVAGELDRALIAATPSFMAALNEAIVDLVEQRVGHRGGAGRDATYRDFLACGPPPFEGGSCPIASQRWLTSMERAFLTSECPEDARLRYAQNFLRGRAGDWWASIQQMDGTSRDCSMPWADFEARFRARYVPQVEVRRLSREFRALRQTTETVEEITGLFLERVIFCPEFTDEESQMEHYLQMLWTDIREFVSMTTYPSLLALSEAARKRELELATQEMERGEKRGPPVSSSVTVPAFKKPKITDARAAQRSRGRAPATGGGRPPIICYTCQQPGHTSRECTVRATICYRCGRAGHKRTECPNQPQTDQGWAAQAPVAHLPGTPDEERGSSG
jgi:Retrotransposon gag protein/Zinc knuckle